MKMEAQIRLIHTENIIPNRFQPRLTFDDSGLQELAASIKEHGIVQPVVVRRVGDKFEIIAGERRFKAAKMLGLPTVPAIIANLDDNESAEVAIVENTARRNLSAIEEAKSYKKLLDRKYLTQEQLAARLGTSQSNIANKIRLLQLDETVQTALLKEQISERHARALLRVTDKAKQVDLLNHIINERWKVRYLEAEIDKILGTYRQEATSDMGGININNRSDVNINDVINNSQDINPGVTDFTPKANYQYENKPRKKEKDSLFFNNLENESVNMDPTTTFGFNPFKKKLDEDEDYELLELEDDDEVKEEVEEEVQENATQVKEVVVDVEYKDMDHTIEGIKKIIKNAKKNQVRVENEEFSFDGYYQFVIRVFKDE